MTLLKTVLDKPPYAFSPLHIPGCVLWLAADRITGLNDGDPVGTWSDLSGNSRDATQGTGAAKPLYKVNVISGKPVVRFDGVDDVLTFTTTNITDYSLFVVVKMLAMAAFAGYFSWNSAAQDGFSVVNDVGVASPFRPNIIDYVNGEKTSRNKINNAGYAVPNTAFQLETYTSTPAIFLNGVSQGITVGSAGYTLTGGQVGGSGDGPGDRAQVDMAEVIVYNRSVGLAEQKRVERYLGNKYGVMVS